MRILQRNDTPEKMSYSAVQLWQATEGAEFSVNGNTIRKCGKLRNRVIGNCMLHLCRYFSAIPRQEPGRARSPSYSERMHLTPVVV